MAAEVDTRVGEQQGTMGKHVVCLVGLEEDGAHQSMMSSPGKKLGAATDGLSSYWVLDDEDDMAVARAQMVEEVGRWWCSLVNMGGG
jgi:hypothetical protein